jgi:hypothetical protein
MDHPFDAPDVARDDKFDPQKRIQRADAERTKLEATDGTGEAELDWDEPALVAHLLAVQGDQGPECVPMDIHLNGDDMFVFPPATDVTPTGRA